MKNARHKARELALQGLYQWLLAEEHADEIRTHLAEFKGYGQGGSEVSRAAAEWASSPMLPSSKPRSVSLLDRPIDELSPVERACC